MIPTFGLMSTVGIFQVYWKENQLEAWSNADISWIISVFGFLAVLLGGPFGILFDSFGPRWLTTPAAIVYCASFIGIAFSSRYWQFMVCFCTAGIGAAVINHWFDKKKGLAMGICTMGGGLGGVIFSVILRFTTNNLDWTTASLVHFAVICAFLSLGCALTRPRVVKVREGKLWDLACFRRWKFLLFTLSVCGMIRARNLFPTITILITVKLGDVFYLTLVFNV
ncbi:putative transporter MCH4 [Colletotrichum liriopes]|uniref:Transporter MCH4 n=1 Tax=Colletotrichum liriopes TaxID=708192 RepID=A0AA37GMT2_9PEZI|nr:putative transporter MCH4 [Colletotrichum liriopes]